MPALRLRKRIARALRALARAVDGGGPASPSTRSADAPGQGVDVSGAPAHWVERVRTAGLLEPAAAKLWRRSGTPRPSAVEHEFGRVVSGATVEQPPFPESPGRDLPNAESPERSNPNPNPSARIVAPRASRPGRLVIGGHRAASEVRRPPRDDRATEAPPPQTPAGPEMLPDAGRRVVSADSAASATESARPIEPTTDARPVANEPRPRLRMSPTQPQPQPPRSQEDRVSASRSPGHRTMSPPADASRALLNPAVPLSTSPGSIAPSYRTPSYTEPTSTEPTSTEPTSTGPTFAGRPTSDPTANPGLTAPIRWTAADDAFLNTPRPPIPAPWPDLPGAQSTSGAETDLTVVEHELARRARWTAERNAV